MLWNLTIQHLLLMIGLPILIFTLFIDRKILRIDRQAVVNFIGLMIGITFVRIGVKSFYIDQGWITYEQLLFFYHSPVWHFLLVFLEDAIFVLPLLLFHKYIIEKQKTIYSTVFFAILVIVFSIVFGIGHLSYGWFHACITLLYPFFISFKLAKKYGLGTVMCCHILYDFITFYTVKFLFFLM